MKPPVRTKLLSLHRGLSSKLIGIFRKHKPTQALIFFFVAALVGLSEAAEPGTRPGSEGKAAADSKPKPAVEVSFLNVAKGFRSGVREPLQTVARSQAEWIALWRKHSNNPNATPPTVLFDQEIAVAVFLGEKPTGGHDVTILRAETSADALVIHYQERTPAPGSIVIQVLEQPFHIVRMSREVGSKVTFRRAP